MKFSLPYSSGLYDVIVELDIIGKVNDVYFSDNNIFLSARNIILSDDEWNELKKINSLGINLHYVVNPSVYNNDFYKEKNILEFVSKINKLNEIGVKYLTFNNSMVMKLGFFRNELNSDIEIKNSVNNRVDSLKKVKQYVEDLCVDHLMLDRSLNRNFDELMKIRDYVDEMKVKFNPKLTITLLANEGCMTDCIYKRECDNMIVQYHKNTSEEIEFLQGVNNILSCTYLYNQKPAEILKSPVILPNAVNKYKKVADVIKLAGRGKPKDLLKDIVRVYTDRTGNIPLFNMFSTKIHDVYQFISSNDLYFENYSQKTLNCKNECDTCTFCDNLLEKIRKGKGI